MARKSNAPAGDPPPAAAGGQPPEFAQAIGGFLETYQRSMTGLLEQMKSAKGMRWEDPAQVLEWMKKSAAFPAAMPGTDAKGAFAAPLDAASLAGTLPGAFATNPLLAGFRHVFAGAHDAVGWGVYSQLADAMTEVAAADLAGRESQGAAWKLFGEIWQRAQARFGDELKAMHARGESFADVQAFLGAWTRALDPVAHEVLQSEAGVAVSAAAMRAASRLRAAQNRAVEVVSEIYNVPTRAEVDEAYRMIHELRKEVRALRKRAG
jgi:predicted outer membrane protein